MNDSSAVRSVRQAAEVFGAPVETIHFSREPDDGTTPGFVYVLYCEKSGLHKIGRSTDVVRRISEISKSVGSPVRHVFSVFDRHTAKLEAGVHRCFCHARRRGEWFELEECEVSDLCLILAGGDE